MLVRPHADFVRLFVQRVQLDLCRDASARGIAAGPVRGAPRRQDHQHFCGAWRRFARRSRRDWWDCFGKAASGCRGIAHISGKRQSDWPMVSGAERSLAIAVTDAAAKLSSAIGVPLIGILLLHFGWRWSFAATGFISLIYFALFLPGLSRSAGRRQAVG